MRNLNITGIDVGWFNPLSPVNLTQRAASTSAIASPRADLRPAINSHYRLLLTFVKISPEPIIADLPAMLTRFFASQSVEIAVPEQPVPIQHYLRQPQRLVKALVDPRRTEQLSPERFRLKMRPLDFMMLQIQPTVDIRVWAKSDGTIHLASVGCEIRGVEYINRRFSLDLVGKLYPVQVDGVTYLRGKADLAVQVEIPQMLLFTPMPILETTGNGLIKSVLLTIKQRLMHQLISDYRHWASGDSRNPVSENPIGLVGDGTPV